MVSRAHDDTSGRCALPFHQRIAHEIANDFAAILRKTATRNKMVEVDKKVFRHCYREAHKITAHTDCLCFELNEIDGNAWCRAGIFIESILRIREERARFVHEPLDLLEHGSGVLIADCQSALWNSLCVQRRFSAT